MAILIGTAGHVDHGKTTLIRALTGVNTDRLPEEKKRGMTIDVGYAFVTLPKSGRVSIVDVPGHERFLTNMLVGAMGVDIAILCIACDEGIKPQTNEHLEILEMLPTSKLIVALTKRDLVEPDLLQLQIQEVETYLGKTRFRKSVIIPVSAETGEGLPELISALDSATQEFEPAPDPNPLWYMPIDRAFVLQGLGSVITGYMARGSVSAPCDAVLTPGNKKVRIRTIQVHDTAVGSSERGNRTAFNITGIDAEDVRRGMTIGAPNAVVETTIVDLKINWIVEPNHGMEVRVAIGSEDAFGKLFLNDNDTSIAQVRFNHSCAATKGQPVIVRRHSPATLLGGGNVITPNAQIRRKSDTIRYVNLTNIEEGIIAAIHEDPNGVATQEICRLMGVSQQQLGDHFERLIKERRIIGFAGIWYQPHIFLAQANIFLKALADLHKEHPMLLSHSREQVLVRTGQKWSGKPLERILAKLAELGKVEVIGTRVKSKEFKITLSPKQESFLQRVEAELNKTLINVPYASDLASDLSVPVQAIDEILIMATNAGRIIKVLDGLYYTFDQIERIKDNLRNIFGPKPFMASEAKESLGTSRKFIIPVLEYLDTTGFTSRMDDRRVINEKAR
jgi:selenocysteine-specific elongation factor